MDATERTRELKEIATIAATEVARIIQQVPQTTFTATATAAAVAATSMQKDVETIKASVEKIESKLENHYVSIDQFDPVKRIVYGVVAVFGLSIVAAIVALIIKQ